MDQPEYCLAEEAAAHLDGAELLECDKASRWLHKKLRTLYDLRPIDLIRTNAGARLVEDALMRIAWGAPGPRATRKPSGAGFSSPRRRYVALPQAIPRLCRNL